VHHSNYFMKLFDTKAFGTGLGNESHNVVNSLRYTLAHQMKAKLNIQTVHKVLALSPIHLVIKTRLIRLTA